MSGKWKFRLPIVMLALGAGVATVAAAPPWLLTTNRIEADPKQEYRLKEENGPWMIMAASFAGEGAEKQAHELVLELRKRYKLPAFSHKILFKLDDPNGPGAPQTPAHLASGELDLRVMGPGLSPPRRQYKQFADHPDQYKDGGIQECAVLVGNYPAVEDPDARKDLQQIRYLAPECLSETGRPSYQTLGTLRHIQEDIREKLFHDASGKGKGPMGHAFITTNPLLSSDYYAPKGTIDEFVLRMNKGVTHSLLDCPGRYTVQVAHFTGTVVLNQQQVQQVEAGRTHLEDRLSEAAETANKLTEALRMKGYEAYEFHDRYASIVTVGSFNSVGTPLADGRVEIHPKILAIMKACGGVAISAGGQATGGFQQKTLVGIPLDVQPIPVEVPKRSISRELAQRMDNGKR
jgi:hypothetical protein